MSDAEMAQHNSLIFPQLTAVGQNVTTRSILPFQAQGRTGGAVTGAFDALEGFTIEFGGAQEHPLSSVEVPSSQIQLTGSPPNAAGTIQEVFPGTTFGDATNTFAYSYQLSRCVGLLR